MASREEAIDAIQQIVRACRNSEEAFRQATEHTKDPELRSFLVDQVEERGQFARELEKRVTQYEAPHAAASKTSSFAGESGRERGMEGKLEGEWMGLKHALGAGDQVILSALVAGDEATRRAYEEAQRQEMLPGTVDMLHSQLQGVLAADDVMKVMRERTRAA